MDALAKLVAAVLVVVAVSWPLLVFIAVIKIVFG